MGSKSRLFAAVATVLLLAACGGEVDLALTACAAASARTASARPPTRRRHLGNDIIGDAFIGLFTKTKPPSLSPGIAESWSSQDQKTWTFQASPWADANGEPLTTCRFRLRFPAPLQSRDRRRRLFLDPVRHQEWPRGERRRALPVDQVGVKAIDDLTLEVHPEYLMPYLPGVLEALQRSRTPSKKFGGDWTKPENLVNGAYKVAEWRKAFHAP